MRTVFDIELAKKLSDEFNHDFAQKFCPLINHVCLTNNCVCYRQSAIESITEDTILFNVYEPTCSNVFNTGLVMHEMYDEIFEE